MFQLSRDQEQLATLEQSLASSQEQLSVQVGEVVRLEQTRRKLSAELKTTKDRIAFCDNEITNQQLTIGTVVIGHQLTMS